MNVNINIDLESMKDKTVVLAHSGVTKARELADAGAAKARELSEIGRLKVSNSVEQEAIRKAYSDLGRLYFAERGDHPEEPYAELCRSITDSLARISCNNERIADIRAAGRCGHGGTDAEAGDGESCCCAGEPAAEEPCCCGGEEPEAEGSCCCCGGEDGKPEE